MQKMLSMKHSGTNLNHNTMETTKSLQFPKLVRQHIKNVEEWIGRFRTEAIKCNYKEIDK